MEWGSDWPRRTPVWELFDHFLPVSPPIPIPYYGEDSFIGRRLFFFYATVESLAHYYITLPFLLSSSFSAFIQSLLNRACLKGVWPAVASQVCTSALSDWRVPGFLR
ncbi:hypothetical protein BDW71DRAFT_179864, partial [Aspergillus fruticulosus]